MAIFSFNISKELNNQFTVEQDGGTLILGNAEANRVMIKVTQDGEHVALEGSIVAQMLRADGQTLTWSGAIISGTAVVVLPASAYSVQGPAKLNIDLLSNDQRMTLAVLRLMVDSTTSNASVAPVDTVPDLESLLAKIQAMQAATNAALSASAFYPMVYTGDVAFPSEGGNTYYAFSNMTKGTTVVTPTTGTSTHYVIVMGDLVAGESFTITARDGTTARPWGMADKDGVLQDCASGQSVTDMTVTVPENCDGGTLFVQVRDTYIDNASVVRNLNLKTVRGTLEMISERLNLFDDTLTYTQRKKDGTTNGVRTPTDGVYTTNLNNGSHGSYSWALPDKTLPAGTYTLSAYVSLASASNRKIYMGIGYASREIVDLTTERGGDTPIGTTDTEGWVKYTCTVPEDAMWAVQLLPINSSDNGSEISQIQLEIGEVITEYTEDKRIAVDSVARAALANIETAPEVDASVPLASLTELQTSSGSADSFLFFTDPHLCEVDEWRPGFDKWMQIFGSYYKQLPVHFALCGGDWMGHDDIPDEARAKLGLIYTEMRKRFDTFHMCVGNHDTNEQGKLTPESQTWTGRLDPQGGANLWYNGRSYYDFTTPSARYFILDTGGEGNGDPYAYYFTAEKKWLADQLLANTAENVVFVQHIVYKTSEVDSNGQPTTTTPTHAVASALLQIAQAFNARAASFSVGNTTYSFTNAVGKVRFVIAGHTHHDSTSTAYGLPIWITGRTVTNDITELRRLDLVVADFTNRVVKAVRIGSATTSPAIRTINMTT